MRLLLMCCLAALPLCAQVEDRAYSQAEIMASVDDGTASELRWLFEAREVWTVSGAIMGDTPRDRTAWSRLLCHADVELLMRITRCENLAAAEYALAALRVLAPEKLVDLLPWLIRQPFEVEAINGDIGFDISSLEFAGYAIEQLSMRSDAKLLTDVVGMWLDRLIAGHVTDADWELGRILAERITPRAMRELPFTNSRRKELLELVPWLTQRDDGPELTPEEVNNLASRPLLRRTLLLFDAESYFGGQVEKFLSAACESLAEDPEAVLVPEELLAMLRLAHGYLAMKSAGASALELSRFLHPLAKLNQEGLKVLVTRFPEADQTLVREFAQHRLATYKPTAEPPAEPAMYPVWFARGHADLHDDSWLELLSNDLAAHPERLRWLGALEDAPLPAVIDGERAPKYWRTLARSKDAYMQEALLRSVCDYGGLVSGLHELADAKDEIALEVKAAIDRLTESDNIRLKWLARDAKFAWAAHAQGAHAGLLLAQAWMTELATDLLEHPRIAVRPRLMLQALYWHEFELADAAGGKDGCATHEDLDAVRAQRDPWYNLVLEVSECNTPFEDRYDLNVLTLPELRALEYTPRRAWDHYAELRAKAEQK